MRNMLKRNRVIGYVLASAVILISTVAIAGPYTSAGLTPFSLTGGAPPSTTLAEMEPSVTVIFAPTDAGFAALDSFLAWASTSANTVSCPKFAIAILKPDDLPDVVTEALVQRKCSLPVYWTTQSQGGALLPQGIHGRVVINSNGTAQGTTFDKLTEEVTKVTAAAAQSTGVVEPKITSGETPLLYPPGGAVVSTGVQVKAVATTGTTVNQVGTTSTVLRQTGAYLNRRYGMKTVFPPNIGWRESRNGDGAIGQALSDPNSKLVWRVWGAPNNMDKTGEPGGQMTALEYVRRLITLTASRLGTQPSFEKRFEVREGDAVGRDYTYTIKPTEGTKVRGRVQAFEVNGVIKAVSVEGPDSEFQAHSEEIDEFFKSFTTQPDLTLQTPQDMPPGAQQPSQPLLQPQPQINHFPQTIPLDNTGFGL